MNGLSSNAKKLPEAKDGASSEMVELGQLSMAVGAVQENVAPQ